MSDVGPELQKAIYAALLSPGPVAGGGVYDNPPDEARRTALNGSAWPYATIGDDQILDAGNSCGEGWEVFCDIHVWSRPATLSKLEAKSVMALIVERLTVLDTVDGFVVVAASLQTTRTFRDPDGITEHGVVSMRFLLDPA